LDSGEQDQGPGSCVERGVGERERDRIREEGEGGGNGSVGAERPDSITAEREEEGQRDGSGEEANGGEGDSVDCSGAQAGLDLSSKIIRNGGRLNLFGWNHGTGTFPGDLWHMNGLTVVNSAPNSALRDPWPAAIRLLERHFIRLRPLVSHVVTLDEYPALLAKAAARQDGYTKGVVKLADPQ